MAFAPVDNSQPEIAGASSLTATVFSRTAGVARTRWNGVPVFWRAQIVGWGLFAIVDLVNLRLLFHEFPTAFRQTALIVVCLVLISTGMRRIYASNTFGNTLTSRAIVWITLLSVGGGAFISALVFVTREFAGWSNAGRSELNELVLPLTHYSILLAGWSLCYFWIHAQVAEQTQHKRAMQAEAEALRAELEELRLQLDPHFLFNALNGVAEEIPEHPDAALAMLRDLTAYLRHSLDGINQTVVTVEAEVGGLAAYLRVQQARFGNRLRTKLHTDPAAASRRIASFLLQPLVENAVKHGRRENGLDLGIDIRLVGDALHIEIENTGSLDSAPKPPQHRAAIGLENVRRRLALHYPGRHRFSLSDRGGGENKVVATLILEGDPCES
ncbi:MAG: histidine kinase [Reyranella sp.]|nr:histidine kinase [Reyranella sp.]